MGVFCCEGLLWCFGYWMIVVGGWASFVDLREEEQVFSCHLLTFPRPV